jgi:putative protease
VKKNPEIVSPAGNIDKLKMAVHFGADAVYFGGEEFNLRAKAGNFSMEDIHEAVKFCADNRADPIFLLNSFLHDDEIDTAIKYIGSLKEIPFKAVMVSDPGMIELVKRHGGDWQIHLSTQMSTLNRYAVEFWRGQGITRIVLARETTLEEIKAIRQHTGAELEVFAHGALCIAYSGRCLLSRYLSGKDANRGDCTQPCRWKYTLVEEKRPDCRLDINEYSRGTEIISSKDLKLLHLIPQYIQAGVDAFKIEGRMKSLYYAANVTRVYRQAVESFLDSESAFNKILPFLESELELISHRPYSADLFNEFGTHGFSGVPYVQRALFMGYWKGGSDGAMKEIAVHNPIYTGDTFDAIYPLRGVPEDEKVTVQKVWVPGRGEERMAKPGETCMIEFDREIKAHAVFRKITEK